MLYVIYTFKIWACPGILSTVFSDVVCRVIIFSDENTTADLLHLMECFIVQIYV